MQALFGLFAGGSAAAAPAATTAGLGSVIGYSAPAAVAATAPTFSISQLLGGATTVLSAAASIAAGRQQAEMYEGQAREAEMQKPLELIQGLQRRNEIKKATAEAVAERDVAYAASGADLTFGTPTVARAQAFREGDYAMNTNAMTTGNMIDELELRRKNYLRLAGNARAMGLFEGLVSGFTGLSKMFA